MTSHRRVEDDLHDLERGALYHFCDWPNPLVPNWRAGVYTIWRGLEFLYVGMAGWQLLEGAHETSEALAATKGEGAAQPADSHASGRRSGDQFCIYVFDRLVLPGLARPDIEAAAGGKLSYDRLVREFIRKELSYRFVVLGDKDEASEVERRIKREGLFGRRPLLNPGRLP